MLIDQNLSTLSNMLFEHSDDCIGIYDVTDERFIRVNQAGVRMLGFYSEPALLTHPVRFRSLRTPPLERVVRDGQYDETTQIGRQDGGSFRG